MLADSAEDLTLLISRAGAAVECICKGFDRGNAGVKAAEAAAGAAAGAAAAAAHAAFVRFGEAF